MRRSWSNPAILLALYLPYVLFFGLAPFTFRSDGMTLVELVGRRFEGMSSVWRLTAWDFWTNVLFFFPLGVLALSLPSLASRRPPSQLLLILSGAGLLSLSIEVAQTLLPRQPSIADVACNIAGALAGGLVGMTVGPAAATLAQHAWRNHREIILRTGMAAYCAAVLLLFSFPLPLRSNFSNWDPQLRFNVGNEVTLSRPWRGTLFEVAIYDRALAPDEIQKHFRANRQGDMRPQSVPVGLVVSYDFSQDGGAIIRDRAAEGASTNLYIEDPSLVRWQSPHGLVVSGSAVISSTPEAARPLYERLTRTNEMTLETWVASDVPVPPGPNPFVSYSDRIDLRNFALAQDGRDLVFWLRTPLTGVHARRDELRTTDHPLTGGLHHIAVTYASRVITLFLDGVERARLRFEKQQAILDLIVDEFGLYYAAGLRSLILCPFGVLLVLAFKGQTSWRLLMVAALAGAALLEAGRGVFLMRPAEPGLAAVSAGAILLAAGAAVRLFPPQNLTGSARA